MKECAYPFKERKAWKEKRCKFETKDLGSPSFDLHNDAKSGICKPGGGDA